MHAARILASTWCIALLLSLACLLSAAGPLLHGAETSPAKPIRVVVWDEQQPGQKPAYDNFLGNAIADYLKKQDGFEVRSVRLDDPQQGLSDDVLDHCDVLVWWGHVRNRDVTPENGKRVLERIKSGQLALIALHSAHWSQPFVQAMWERTMEEARKKAADELTSLPADQRESHISYVYPILYTVPKREAPLTPSYKVQKNPDGTDWLVVHLPFCVFPSYRPDGKPSHVRTVMPEHPISRGLPAEWDVPQTEMYDEPFHVPTPDAVIFEEHWDKGEHFRSGCLWTVGKGKVFYFRPGHETYPVYKEALPLKVIENAARYLGQK